MSSRETAPEPGPLTHATATTPADQSQDRDVLGSDRSAPPREFSRRECLTCLASAGLGVCVAGTLGAPALAGINDRRLHGAKYYRRLWGGRTRCMLCPNACVRERGQDGQCRARGNRGGVYYSLVYGRPAVLALDEVEKCPLYHFQIGGRTFSIATAGCNLTCSYCQNWTFSQVGPDEAPKSYELTPKEVVDKAVENEAAAVAFFYTEPTVYYEYMLDIAKLARRRRLKTVMVTAGYIEPEPLKELLPHIDAVTLGLKGWDEAFYRETIGGELKYVKRTIEMLARQDGVWWEVVNLIVPSLNDKAEDIAAMAAWLYETAGPERPLHFTRFRPEYRLKRLPITPAASLTAAREAAMAAGIKYVYVGNLPGHEGANTYCPSCGKLLVERLGFKIVDNQVLNVKCRFCDRRIGGVWI